MRVLHVVPAYAPTRGGIEVLIESLTPVLDSEHGVVSEVLAPRHGAQRPDDCLVAGARVRSIDLIDGRETRHEAKELAAIFGRVRRAVEDANPQLLHVHGYSPLALPAVNVARTRGIPYVMHVHGGVEAPLPEHFHRLVREAPLVIAVSQHVEASIREVSQRVGPISVLPNGVQVAEVLTEDLPASQHIGMVGRLEPEKGFTDAVAALAPLRAAFPAMEVHVVGVGGELTAIQNAARRGGLARHLHLHGELSHAQTLDVMRSCRVVVVPSTSVEGFSLVAAEAGLLGRPVVATSVAGLRETVVDGVTGTLVGVGDDAALREAVGAYLADADLAGRHGRLGRERARERFSLGEMAERLSVLYRRALEEPHG